MNTQDFATRVSSNLKEDNDPTLDPFTIIMIIQLIVKLIGVIQECNKEVDVKNLSASDKAAGINNIRKNLPFGQKFLAKRVFRGIMDEAQKADAQELKNLVDQVG